MSVHHRARAGVALFALAAASLPFAAQAEENQPVELAALDTILVVGQQDAPITIEPRGLSVSLGEEQFEGINAYNVEDLMKYAPDFFVRKRFIGDNNAVAGFRGTHSTQSARSLVMVDGFNISNLLGNSFSFPPKWGIIGPGEVKQFDVVYGPYSARYMGNSMGGIINITTRDPEGTEAFGKVQGISQHYRQYGTDDDHWGWSAEGGFGLKQENGPLTLRVSARRLRNEGQTQQFYSLVATGNAAGAIPVTGAVADTRNPNAVKPLYFGDYSAVDTTQDQLRAKLIVDGGDVRLSALVTYWWNTEDETHPTTYLRNAAGAPVYGGTGGSVKVLQDGKAYVANGSNLTLRSKREWLGGVGAEADLAPGWTAKLNLSTVRTDDQRVRTSNGYANGVANAAGTLTLTGPTGWYTGDFVAEGDLGAHQLALGANAHLYETDQTQFATTNWRAATGQSFNNRTFGKSWQIGLYAEDEIALSDALSLTAGIRADFWRAFDGGVERLGSGGAVVGQLYDSRSESAVSPTLSATWRLAPDWSAGLSLAMATRFPTVGELFQGALNGDGTFNPASFDPNLKPEKSRDANLVIRHDMGPVTLTGSAFWQRVEDTLFRFSGVTDQGVSTSRNFNIDRTRQYGLELIAETRDWPVDGMDIEGNVAWIDSEVTRNEANPATVGRQFPRIPRWRLNGNVRYRPADKLLLSVGARYASRPNTNLENDLRGDTYGFTSELFALDARISYDLTERLTLSAGADNITNDKAWVYHPYPQRTFLVEAGWRL